MGVARAREGVLRKYVGGTRGAGAGVKEDNRTGQRGQNDRECRLRDSPDAPDDKRCRGQRRRCLPRGHRGIDQSAAHEVSGDANAGPATGANRRDGIGIHRNTLGGVDNCQSFVGVSADHGFKQFAGANEDPIKEGVGLKGRQCAIDDCCGSTITTEGVECDSNAS